MTENVPSDLQDQMVIDDFFVDPAPRPVRPPQLPVQVRSEEDLSLRSLVLGALICGGILATCIVTWLAVLAAPMLALRTLL